MRFDFKAKSTADQKSTIICLVSIGTEKGETFVLPTEYQPAQLHSVLCETAAYGRVKNSLKKRGQYRKVWITLEENLKEVYLDKEENVIFEDILLEEWIEDKESVSEADDSLKKLLEKVMEEKSSNSEVRNLSKIAQDFMIEKFDGRNLNANQWMEEFEEECERCVVVEDRRKIEILKFFLERASADWYSCMLIKFTVQSVWTEWKKKFCETFGNKGWAPIRYAFTFRYQTGSLLDYALKKEKLLLQVRKEIDEETLIDLIAIGLPNYIADKINRENIRKTHDLYNEIGRLENLAGKNMSEKKGRNYVTSKFTKIEEKKPCQICEKANRGKRFHPETECWFKEKTERFRRTEQARTVNSAQLEVELSEEDQKN
uniref:Retrotransposon gag domain-containing protein n=1 Tax=Trichogramma kaykai TaxID=54128 RepID=A0ABD2WAX8_9HYME